MGVRASLRAPRLIPRALKLTTMQASSCHHMSNHRTRICNLTSLLQHRGWCLLDDVRVRSICEVILDLSFWTISGMVLELLNYAWRLKDGLQFWFTIDFMICPINKEMSTLMVTSINQSTISLYLFDLKKKNKKLIQIKITQPRKYCDILKNIVLKLGLTWRVDPGLEPDQVEKKIRKIMTRCDPADPAGWPGQKPGCNPLTFVFVFY